MQKCTVEVVVISLATAVERRREMTSMLGPSGWSWSFFDAHTSLGNRDLHYDPHEAKRRFGRTLGAQEIAVYSSQFAVMKEFLEHGTSDYLLVLEDDVIVDVTFPINEFASFCSKRRIEYIRLFGKHFASAVRLGFFYDRSVIRYKTSPAGAQAYLVSKGGARTITNRFRSVSMTPDLAMDRFWESRVPIYGLFPFPVIERYSPTSIPIPVDTHQLDVADRLIWNMHRAIDKAKKIYANFRLRKSDARMQRVLPSFSQIESTIPK